MASINATTSSGIVATADNTATLQLQTAGTNALNIDASQNVGIGTTSPSYRLDLFGTNCSLQIRDIGQTNGLLLKQNNSDGGNLIYATNNNYLALGTNNTERMRIDSSGALLVNVTANLGNSATKMNVAFDQSLGPGFVIKNNSGSYNTNASIAFINASNGSAGYIILTNATTTAYVTTSDYRLKENIAPMTGALDKVLQLKPVTYKWKVDGSDGQGFIAHELQAVVPDAVSGEKDAVETYTDEEGNEQTRIKPQGVDTSFLVATLTAAIQEMKAIIDEQSVTINDLKARIEVLEAK